MSLEHLKQTDPEIAAVLDAELARQRDCVELIASENFTSLAVLEATGSVLTNKYAEGYPGKRYYGGCEKVDMAENIARERACRLFGAQFANVQPHCGSSANMAAYMAMAKPGDTIMGMSLSHGGHLTHGAKASFSGKLYNSVSYGVDPETEQIDYDALERQVKNVRPQVLVGGASAYPRFIDFERMAKIAHEAGAYLMIDMAHIAGLVAGGAHPSPVPHADITTSTSHKTLRGPRGGFILTNSEELYAKINKAIFPGAQGGPLMHAISAKAVAFGEALAPEFRTYAENVVENSRLMGEGAIEGGLRLVTGGTDNHLCLIDLTATGVTGKEAETLLESVGLTCNKNTIPNEQRPPHIASGIRVGSAAGTTRGITGEEFRLIGELIAATLFNAGDDAMLADIRRKVDAILAAHPLYPELTY